MMHRSVGKHQADEAISWGDRPRQSRIRAAADQYDRPARPAQQPFLGLVDKSQAPRRLEIGRHYGERLVFAMLARAQRAGRGFVGGSRRQMVSAESFDRDNVSGGDQARSGVNRIAGDFDPGAVDQAQTRSASRTA